VAQVRSLSLDELDERTLRALLCVGNERSTRVWAPNSKAPNSAPCVVRQGCGITATHTAASHARTLARDI
jgi:hypothetical protein